VNDRITKKEMKRKTRHNWQEGEALYFFFVMRLTKYYGNSLEQLCQT